MKTLYLLRHAKAEPGDKTLSDMDRPLSGRGMEACTALGKYLAAKRYRPALALISPSRRTLQTFESVMHAAEQGIAMRVVNKLYLASEEEILRMVQAVEEDVRSLLVVGHNPGMHHASLSFASADETSLRHQLELKYPTGALAVLRFGCESWAQVAFGEGELRDFMTPRGL